MGEFAGYTSEQKYRVAWSGGASESMTLDEAKSLQASMNQKRVKKKKTYVLGFYFSPHGCVLIEKTKPDWQKGKVNGLGGSVELTDATLYDAMSREFLEESGVKTDPLNWEMGMVIFSSEWELYTFRYRGDHVPVRSCDEGMVSWYGLPPDNMEQTALWLYWMCRDDSTFHLFKNSSVLLNDD